MNTHFVNKIRPTTAAIVLISTLFAVTPAKAISSAHNLCVGATCRGKDPAVMGCERDARTTAKAHTITETPIRAEVIVELRYSPVPGALGRNS